MAVLKVPREGSMTDKSIDQSQHSPSSHAGSQAVTSQLVPTRKSAATTNSEKLV